MRIRSRVFAAVAAFALLAASFPAATQTATKPPRIAYVWLFSQGPKNPWSPNNTTNIKPATTGDTENGRSISVMRMGLPGNSNLAIAHAAANPNRTFSGTVMAATSSVRRIAAIESGCTSDFQ